MAGGYLTNPDAVRLLDLIVQHLRQPTTFVLDDADAPVATFEPPLTVGEQTTYDLLVLLARSETGLNPTDYATVRTQMRVLRDLRQAGRNAYVNMTEGDRNRLQYDVDVAILEVFLKLFRDV